MSFSDLVDRAGAAWARRGACLASLVAAAVAVAGCNLRPMYGGQEGKAVATELAGITVRTAQYELAQTVGREIEESLNPGGITVDQPLELLIEVELYQTNLTIQLQGTATRRDLYLLTSYALRRKGETALLLSSAVRTVASYDLRRQPYAELAARWDAERRAGAEIAQQIRTRLTLYLRRNEA